MFDERPGPVAQLPTHFAPAERTAPDLLRREAEACLAHPVASFLIEAMDGLVMILDPNRQVLATNDRIKAATGDEADSLLGRRPGEVFGCMHVPGSPGGCGTNHACRHCGAVLAILEAQSSGQPVHSECMMTFERNGVKESAEFQLVASPLQVGGHSFVVLVLHDLSAAKRRDALERLFYHDIANLMQGIRGWADLLANGSPNATTVAQKLAHLTDLLDRELRSHRAMAEAEHGKLKPRLRTVHPQEILADVSDLLRRHSLARDRHVVVEPAPAETLLSDPELLSRIVLNMAVNAVEASFGGDAITLACRMDGDRVRFSVHNPGQIPEEARTRIFQRSFSTKGTPGRGLGTYAMRLFGEAVLGGRVSFDTGPEGTTFWVELPLTPARERLVG